MTENIVPPAPSGSDLEGRAQPRQDSERGRSDPIGVANIPPTLPHAHFSWWVMITISFIFLAGVSAFLFWQNQTLRARLVPSPTPLDSPTSSPDSTSNWQTYISDEYGFSFKYPLEYQVIERVPGFLTITTKEDQNRNQAGISIETRTQKPYDNYSDAASYFYKTFSQSNTRSITDRTNDRKDHQVSWVLFDGVGKAGQLEGLHFHIAYKQYKSGVITVETIEQPNYSAVFDTIISTFEFTDDLYTSTKYTCPANGWQSCMPILSEEGKKACSEEAMVWYKANCPDFQGAAL